MEYIYILIIIVLLVVIVVMAFNKKRSACCLDKHIEQTYDSSESILDNVSVGFYTRNLFGDKGYIVFNNVVKDIYGCDDVISSPLWDQVNEDLEDMNIDNKSETFSRTIKTPDGENKNYIVTKQKTACCNGDIIIASVIDVTHERLYNEKLSALIKQNELIMDNTNSGIVFITPDYKVAWENISRTKTIKNLLSYKTGEYCYISKGLDKPCSDCIVRDAINSNSSQILEPIFDNSDTVIEILASPVSNEKGEQEGVVLRIDDITERKRMFEKLKMSEESAKAYNMLIATILDRMPCMLFIKDVGDNYRYILANKNFCEALGKPEYDVVGRTDYDLFPREEADRFHEDDSKAIGMNDVQVIEEVTLWQGKYTIWHTTKSPFIAADGRKFLIGMSLDITNVNAAYKELKLAKDKAEQSDKLKSTFLANMSHEIRTPLNAIVGFSELLQFAETEEEKEQYSSIISRNSEQLLTLIGDILDLSKIDAGYVDLIETDFDINTIFNDLMVMFSNKVEKDVMLRCNIPSEHCIVHLDNKRITQVLVNFMTNSVKFTTKGYIEIGYEIVGKDLKLYVKDSGCGISEENKYKVFDRFEKLNSFAKGTGLGMPISKAIIEASGGKIGFDSKLNEGSIFWAVIKDCILDKVSVTDISHSKETPRKVAFENSDRPKKTDTLNILIAEDIDSNFILIRSLLKHHNVSRAVNGAEAVKLVKENNYDIILMDIKMPIMDGIEATRQIREFNSDITIIAVTANAFYQNKVNAIDAGCNDFLEKPLNESFINRVLEHLK